MTTSDTTSWHHSMDSQPSVGEIVEITTYPANRKALARIRWDVSNNPMPGWRPTGLAPDGSFKSGRT
jgi:hypothetical protein